MPAFTSAIQPITGTSITTSILTRSQLYTAITTGQTLTFNNCGATGRTGPTLAQCQTQYGTTSPQAGYSTWGNDRKLFDCAQGVQFWTVFKTGTYRIRAAGAQGGRDSAAGRGAIVESDFSLNAGEVLRIVVGQKGTASGNYSGGGGGTAVALYRLGSFVPLIVAGGGGGTVNNNPTSNGGTGEGDAFTTNRGGPTPGNGSKYDNGYDGDIADFWHGGGGGSWATDGGYGSIGLWCGWHQVEGASLSSVAPIGGLSEQNILGGFGGGGGSGRDGGSSGGGGGFHGGDASWVTSNGAFANGLANGGGNFATFRGGGGGSYSLAGSYTFSANTSSGNTGHGYVTVTCP